MGFYSSWALLALTHHVIMRMAIKDTGIENCNWYRLLGDDIVMDLRLKPAYLNILQQIGVETSPVKGLDGSSAEFAKRVVQDGVEISPLPPKLIEECRKNMTLLPVLLSHVVRDRSDAATLSLDESFLRKLCYCIYPSKDKCNRAFIVLAASSVAKAAPSAVFGEVALQWDHSAMLRVNSEHDRFEVMHSKTGKIL